MRTPLRGTYRGYDIVSMPPPSSGGTHLIEMLNILEGFPLGDAECRPRLRIAAALHLMIEAMKLAYADRAEFLGDSDMVDVPIDRLISKAYADDAARRRSIRTARAVVARASGHSTVGRRRQHHAFLRRRPRRQRRRQHLLAQFQLSVLGLVADGTGILLNNTLDDFAAKPGAPNAFGLVGGDANAPGPNKRPLSSMTPTIVLKDGKPAIVTGAPGGSRIITAVLQVIVNVIDFRKAIGDAVAAPRVHHQWLPDQVLVERNLPADTIRALQALGHDVRVGPPSGSAHSIAVTPGGLVGAADGRARGTLAAGN